MAIVQMLHSEALYCFLSFQPPTETCQPTMVRRSIQDHHTARIKLVHNGATQPHIFSIKHCVFTFSEQTKTFLVFITVLHHRCWFQGHGVSPNLTLGEGFFFLLFIFFPHNMSGEIKSRFLRFSMKCVWGAGLKHSFYQAAKTF